MSLDSSRTESISTPSSRHSQSISYRHNPYQSVEFSLPDEPTALGVAPRSKLRSSFSLLPQYPLELPHPRRGSSVFRPLSIRSCVTSHTPTTVNTPTLAATYSEGYTMSVSGCRGDRGSSSNVDEMASASVPYLQPPTLGVHLPGPTHRSTNVLTPKQGNSLCSASCSLINVQPTTLEPASPVGPRVASDSGGGGYLSRVPACESSLPRAATSMPEVRLGALCNSTSARTAPAAADSVADHYKVKMCKNFSTRGRCPYGHACRFAHGEADMRTYAQNVHDGITSEFALRRFLREIKGITYK